MAATKHTLVAPMVPPGAALADVVEEPRKEVAAWQRRSTP